jgi:hypothetical protein
MADEQGRIDGWWNDVPPQVIQREISRVLVLNLSGKKAVPKTPTEYFCP